jgi:hypothetical protein
MNGPRTWLLLTYKVPRHPSARRVYVWRKLKQLGAILLHDSVWVLPDSDRTAEQFRWLAEEIKELGGRASLWTSHATTQEQESELVCAFSEDVDKAYGQILAQLRRSRADVATLSRRYHEVLARDYFRSPAGEQVREALVRTKGGGRSR